MSEQARGLLAQLRALELEQPLRIVNVCGGHERSISQAGLRQLLPPRLELIPGPGCPVCICPEEAIHAAMHYALEDGHTVLAYGDMLRVPINVGKGQPRSLEQARAAGADIRPIASPQQAVSIAQARPDRQVIFLAAGFETTTAPLAAQVLQGLPDNLLLLMAARRTWPAVAMLLEGDSRQVDALIAPGHVAAVMGSEEWRFICRDHGLPVAVAGFSAESLLAATLMVARQHLLGEARLENAYPEVVSTEGNRAAQAMLEEVFAIRPANWRGIGSIPASGYFLQDSWAGHDAERQLGLPEQARRRAGEMPPGCACAEVILAQRLPDQCPLYGKPCTPDNPIGPCMVSDEGACHIWWQYSQNKQRQAR